jgi:hypothetical protein
VEPTRGRSVTPSPPWGGCFTRFFGRDEV